MRPGWYPDPAGTDRLRWWDGSKWTDTYQYQTKPSEVVNVNAWKAWQNIKAWQSESAWV
jgi:hypothetical protein